MALRFLVDARKKLGYQNVVRFESGLNTNSDTGGWPFIGGAYAIVQDGQWRVEQLRKYAPEIPYRTAIIPPPPGGRPNAGFSGGNFMIIPRAARQAKGAFEFLKFWSGLSRPDRAAEFYTWGGWLPLSKAIADSPIYRKYLLDNPQFKTFVDLLPSPNLEVVPPVPYQVFLMDRIGHAEDEAVRGAKTPDAAIDELKGDLDRELARRHEMGYPQ